MSDQRERVTDTMSGSDALLWTTGRDPVCWTGTVAGMASGLPPTGRTSGSWPAAGLYTRSGCGYRKQRQRRCTAMKELVYPGSCCSVPSSWPTRWRSST